MKAIICNTGPMIALAGIRRLELLRDLFESVSVPMPVHEEFMAGGKIFNGLTEYCAANWIKVIETKVQADPLLETILDVGEASVICAAKQSSVTNMILMDERKGRKIARNIYKLEVIGTARVLVEAKRAGLLSDIDKAFSDMKLSGYWIHERIIQAAMKELERN